MEFRWQAGDGPLLWYLDPLSPHRLKRHEIYIIKTPLSDSKLSGSASAKRERERKKEREKEREHMVPLKLFHIILTSMLYKQLIACTLLLCDVK